MKQTHYSARVRGLIGFFIGLSTLTLLYWYQQTAQPSGTDNWYVAPYGSDRAVGTREHPFGSLEHALSHIDGVGGTIYLKSGVYRLKTPLKSAATGTAKAWIRISSEPGTSVTIDCAATGVDTPCLTFTGAYLELSSLTIINAQKTAITLAEQAHHIRIKDNVIRDAQFGGIYTYAEQPDDLKEHLEISGNIVTRTCLVNVPPPPGDGSGWPAAILVSASDHVTLTHNIVYENFGEGIIVSARYALVESNTLHDNYSVNLYLDNAHYTTVRRNFIYSTQNADFFRYNYPAIGIGLANERDPGEDALEHNIIVNNIVVDGRFVFSYSGYRASNNIGTAGGTNYGLIANNTFFGGRDATIYVDITNVRHRDTSFINNIFYQPHGDRPLTNLVNPMGLIFESNVWHGGKLSLISPDDVLTDPQLSNPGGIQPEDYMPLPDSPIIDAGVVTPTSTDFLGHARPIQVRYSSEQFYDIGAFELQQRP